ncbi:hypothetical protein Syun_012616 [Stephania yunnanensis]|uniref:Uncharacterized protein n=1 Tax=Stephania yunnanensis TaxID=152371 RepID=A0AAP0PJM5_9MAGN
MFRYNDDSKTYTVPVEGLRSDEGFGDGEVQQRTTANDPTADPADDHSAHSRLQKVSQVVPRVVERLLERLTDGSISVANDLRIEEVELGFEFGEGGLDERLEIHVEDEEVEENVLQIERVSENRMDGDDPSSEVLDVESNGDVDGRSGRTAISGRERSPDRRSRT